jgi:nicotinamide mononucleotide adenylyltransferase
MASNTLGTEQDDAYVFPSHRISQTMRDDSKIPVVLVACGSFSPVTYLHLRMFEMARDYIKQQTQFEVVGGYLSPVNDQYKKPGLLSAGRFLPLPRRPLLIIHNSS